MALTLTGPILHGISLVSGGNANLPDQYITPIGYDAQTIYINDYQEYEHRAESLGEFATLSNGASYDPFQSYDAPKREGPETWPFRIVGYKSGSTYEFGHNVVADIEADYLGKRIYVFFLWFSGGSSFSFFPLWRLTARLKSISYRDIRQYGHRITEGSITFNRVPGTYSQIGSVNSPSP